MKRALLVLLTGMTVLACSKVDDDKVTNVVGPDRAQFTAVQTYLEHRCGSLDCHGTMYRNFRVWGSDGMRLEIGYVPGGAATTKAEIEATYQSLVELEPEKMQLVVSQKGAQPERLTWIRKPRGLEKHVGATIMNAGDPRDRCLVSWLEGTTDKTACRAALALP